MAPKKAASAPAKAKTSTAAPHSSYKDMVKDAIMKLKERKGSSRSSIKKYVLANNTDLPANQATFDNLLNKAIKSGVEKGDFEQPKGPSGTVKLVKKESAAAKSTEKKPAAEKKPAEKKSTPPKKPGRPAASKTKTTATVTKAKKPAATTSAKSTAGKVKPGPGRPASNTKAKRASKTPAAAPAIVEEKKVLGKTKSGRVTKSLKAPTPKKAAPKKTTKKSTPAKKAATPKKAAAEAPAAAA
ncbi:hypothetical protein MMC28_000981 [Mycoblastus sanguinarius]|nr:hypothetical protein [Mycoblastus sanguinarius]